MPSRLSSLAVVAAAIVVLLSVQTARGECNPRALAHNRWTLQRQGATWWLVNPCGERFFSIGINGLDPDALDPHAPTYRAGSAPRLHGAPEAWARRTAERVQQWGFNTAGGYSVTNMPMLSVPELDLGWRAHFHWSDPFSPAAAERMKVAAREAVAPFKASGYRIGYFSDNEVGWWNGALFTYFIQQPEKNQTKQRLISLLREQYQNDWNRFNSDFVVPAKISSFGELLQSKGVIAQLRPGGEGIRVVRRWTALMAERYYRLVHEALSAADPGALIFGDRLPIYYDPDAVRAMAPYVDAVATNYNVDSPDGWIAHYYFNGLRELSGDKPIIISEWFYAARQNRSGDLNVGHLMTVKTQAERAKGAVDAVQRFASDPNIVGIHWFQYYDEPKGGRRDGENYDFGLVDTAEGPYQELVEAFDRINPRLSEIHRGATAQTAVNGGSELSIPEAEIDVRRPSLAMWPKDEALVKGLAAPRPEVQFGDMFLAWSTRGLHVATISMDYYDPDLLAYSHDFPLGEAFRIDLGVDAGAGARRFAFYVIPPKVFPKKGAPAMRIKVCAMNHQRCEAVPSAVATYAGSDQPRITGQITIPWGAFGMAGPPSSRRLRLQLAATAFYRSRWMSLGGVPPAEAMKDVATWHTARLGAGHDVQISSRQATTVSVTSR